NHGLAQAKTYPASQFGIDKFLISHGALTVMSQLHKANYQAYLVGGAIRDMILGLAPKDFDIATNATPDKSKPFFAERALLAVVFVLCMFIKAKKLLKSPRFAAITKNNTKPIAMMTASYCAIMCLAALKKMLIGAISALMRCITIASHTAF